MLYLTVKLNLFDIHINMNKQGSLTWQLSSECLWVGKTASIKPILSKQRKHKVRVLSNDNK